MKTYHISDVIPRAILESRMPKVKIGYASHLLECVTRRVFLEGSEAVGSTFNRIANNTLNELNKKSSIEPDAFNSLIIFSEKINNILKQLTAQYANESDPEAKKNIAKIVTSSKFLSNPAQDGILKNALSGAKSAQGNRLATFIRLIINQIIEKKDANPIQAFKKEISNLQDAIAKYYYSDFPFQATIKPYKTYLLGPNSIVDVMDKIADNLIHSEDEITKMQKNSIFGNEADPSNVMGDYQTSHKYESQNSFMEAFAESLDYFSRKK